MCEKQLTPGDINNYAYGYQDFTGYSSDRRKKDEPVLPDDEGYMRGWFSGQYSMAEDIWSNRKKRKEGFVHTRPYVQLLKEWNEWRIAHGLPKETHLPL